MNPRTAAEFIGTFWLVLGGCGSAVLAAVLPGVGIGILGVSLAFGLSLFTITCAVGSISGGHFNPAVSVGLWIGGRFDIEDVMPYILAQVAGAITASLVLYFIASSASHFDIANGFATNGYEEHSPFGYSMAAAFATETVMTFMFLFIILGASDERAPKELAPLAAGMALTLIHLISMPVTNTSINPARSTGPAVIVGGWAIKQLWLFWVAPILGAWLAGVTYRWLRK